MLTVIAMTAEGVSSIACPKPMLATVCERVAAVGGIVLAVRAAVAR